MHVSLLATENKLKQSINLFLNEIKVLLSRFFFNLRKHGQCFELHCNVMLFILLINVIVYLKCFTNHGGNLYKILTLQSVLYTSVLCKDIISLVNRSIIVINYLFLNSSKV